MKHRLNMKPGISNRKSLPCRQAGPPADVQVLRLGMEPAYLP
jgi:hypothetical protein